jgi:hypothetical protein
VLTQSLPNCITVIFCSKSYKPNRLFTDKKNASASFKKIIEPPRHKGHQGISQRVHVIFYTIDSQYPFVLRGSAIVSWWLAKSYIFPLLFKIL